MEKLGASVKTRRLCRKAVLTNATYKTFPSLVSSSVYTAIFREETSCYLDFAALTPIHTARPENRRSRVVKNTIKLVKFALGQFNERP